MNKTLISISLAMVCGSATVKAGDIYDYLKTVEPNEKTVQIETCFDLGSYGKGYPVQLGQVIQSDAVYTCDATVCGEVGRITLVTDANAAINHASVEFHKDIDSAEWLKDVTEWCGP
jgi:hypothetical protein